jgi:hypothetical protein
MKNYGTLVVRRVCMYWWLIPLFQGQAVHATDRLVSSAFCLACALRVSEASS